MLLQYSMDQHSNNLLINLENEKPKKPKKVKPYAENEALRRGQKKYKEKNREAVLEYARQYNKTWRETEDKEVVKAKQREKAARYYQKKREMKTLQKQQEALLNNKTTTEESTSNKSTSIQSSTNIENNISEPDIEVVKAKQREKSSKVLPKEKGYEEGITKAARSFIK